MQPTDRYIHDECYGVQIDAAGNYLLMGGSGDEYGQYSVTNSDGWSSDIWVSYLVVLDKQVSQLYYTDTQLTVLEDDDRLKPTIF